VEKVLKNPLLKDLPYLNLLSHKHPCYGRRSRASEGSILQGRGGKKRSSGEAALRGGSKGAASKKKCRTQKRLGPVKAGFDHSPRGERSLKAEDRGAKGTPA